MPLTPEEIEDRRPNAATLSWKLDTQVLELADQYFALQVLGQRRSYDVLLIGAPLVYRVYSNGLECQDGTPHSLWPGEAGVLSLTRNLFEYQRALGNDVIVWRQLPVLEQRTGLYYKAENRTRFFFRCAFTKHQGLRALRGANDAAV